jgi:hypothetical protein
MNLLPTFEGHLAAAGLTGLQEVARSGRPRRIGQAQRLELVSRASEPAEARGRTTPTLDERMNWSSVP